MRSCDLLCKGLLKTIGLARVAITLGADYTSKKGWSILYTTLCFDVV